MNTNFVKFADWESKKYKSVEEDAPNSSATSVQDGSNAALHARLADLSNVRRDSVRVKDDIKTQIIDLEIRLIKIDIEKNDILKKKADLESAYSINKKNSTEGKTNVKENEK
jgi:hypothetical protein